ncbi:hypothetical protein AnigIFM59636_000998 [Aspergillus niger]|nr:hypothetical protein AnigIFM59636_000998 [Aspergillus niger]
MGDETLEDAAPSAAERQAVYEKGFRIWKSLYLHATQESSFPRTCFDIQPILTKQPQFPNDLDLKASYNHLFVQGTSTWKGSEDCNMPSQERHLQIPVSIKCPIPLSLSADIDESYLEWFTLEESHIAVLMCAWSYTLSARWAELMPEAILAYTEGTAYNSDGSGDQNSVTVDIGGVDDDARNRFLASPITAEKVPTSEHLSQIQLPWAYYVIIARYMALWIRAMQHCQPSYFFQWYMTTERLSKFRDQYKGTNPTTNSTEEHHTRWPICQWTPFGVTALQDTEIDVRLHADCAGHCLQYAGWKWTCQNGRVAYQMSDNTPPPNLPPEEPVVTNVTIDYQGLNHGDEGVSENATRSIFGWLRVEGFPPNEKKIHDWIYIDESDYEHP